MVGLAYELGYLSSRDSTWLQRWALAYHHLDQQRTKAREQARFSETLSSVLDYLTLIINPKLYVKLHPDTEEEPESEFIGADQLDKLDNVLRQLDQRATAGLDSPTAQWSDWS